MAIGTAWVVPTRHDSGWVAHHPVSCCSLVAHTVESPPAGKASSPSRCSLAATGTARVVPTRHERAAISARFIAPDLALSDMHDGLLMARPCMRRR